MPMDGGARVRELIIDGDLDGRVSCNIMGYETNEMLL